MTAAQKDRDALGMPGEFVIATVASGYTVYKNTLVGLDSSGNAQPKDASGNVFGGVSQEYGKNPAAAAFDTTKIHLLRKGIFEFVMSGATAGLIGDELYVVDDQTVASSGTTKVGRAAKYLNADKIFIDIGGYC